MLKKLVYKIEYRVFAITQIGGLLFLFDAILNLFNPVLSYHFYGYEIEKIVDTITRVGGFVILFIIGIGIICIFIYENNIDDIEKDYILIGRDGFIDTIWCPVCKIELEKTLDHYPYRRSCPKCKSRFKSRDTYY